MKHSPFYLLLVAAVVFSPLTASGQLFDPPVDYSTNLGAYFVVLGNLDADNQLDMAIANGSYLEVRYNNGDGTFGAANIRPGGSYARSLVITDVNNDSVMDICLSNYWTTGVMTVLQNTSDTYFTTDGWSSGCTWSTWISSADFDGDTYNDIVTVGATNNYVSVLKNNQNAWYVGYATYAVGTSPQACEAVDLNGDTHPDIAVTCVASGEVSILINNTFGDFDAPAVNYPVGIEPSGLTYADFNDDTYLDLAVGHNDSAYVTILFGNGDGTFQTAVNIPTSAGPRAPRAVDLDSDGDIDIASALFDLDSVSIILNYGDGTFRAEDRYQAGDGPSFVYAGDVDGDTWPDLVVGNVNGFSVSVLISNGPAMAVEERPGDQLPNDYSLAQNYPNPFNPATNIEFDLPQGSHVKLEIYNLLGAKIRTLVDERLSAGQKIISWNGTDINDNRVSSGVYFYQLSVEGSSETKKMIMLK